MVPGVTKVLSLLTRVHLQSLREKKNFDVVVRTNQGLQPLSHPIISRFLICMRDEEKGLNRMRLTRNCCIWSLYVDSLCQSTTVFDYCSVATAACKSLSDYCI